MAEAWRPKTCSGSPVPSVRVKPLPADALYRSPKGSVTARAPLVNEDAERAIAALGAAVNHDAALPADVRQTVAAAVMAQWNRVPYNALVGPAHRFAAELLVTREVTDATFDAALQAFGEQRLVNLLILMGYSNIRCAQSALVGTACTL